MVVTKFDLRTRDLTGRTFGNLTATTATQERTESGSVIWVCTCTCGIAVKRSSASLLRRSLRSSCGCLRRGCTSKRFTGVGDLSGERWANIRRGALRRGIPFTITATYAWNLYEQQGRRCAFTGVPLAMAVSDMRAGRTTASLDRINSSLGYVQGNVQWVLVAVNLMKQTFSSDEFIRLCKLVTAYSGETAYASGREDAVELNGRY